MKRFCIDNFYNYFPNKCLAYFNLNTLATIEALSIASILCLLTLFSLSFLYPVKCLINELYCSFSLYLLSNEKYLITLSNWLNILTSLFSVVVNGVILQWFSKAFLSKR